MPKTISIPLASQNNSFKSYMSYKKITNKSSSQYKFIHSGEITYCEDGLLRDSNGYIAVAIGDYYSSYIGERFIVTFDSGNKAYLIKCDEKAIDDTVGGANQNTDGSMIEFIIDIDKAKLSYNKAIEDGNFNSIEEFKGNIVKIERVVEL